MNNKTNKLTEWAVNKIKTEFPDDIALLIAVEGHSVNGDGHGESFDYFVPSTERGNELSRTFIIDGIGHDLYPRSWERTERTAGLDDPATTCLSNAIILYSRTEEDKNRFLAIQKKLYENLNNQTFIYKKALETLDNAMSLYRTLMFEEKPYKVRMATGYIWHYLALSVAYLNHTFFKSHTVSEIQQIQTFQDLPDTFIAYYEAVIRAQTTDDLKTVAHQIISTTRAFIASHKPVNLQTQKQPDFAGLADWYQELSLTWRRIRYYCEIKNSDLAFTDACFLQNELSIVKEEFILQEMDLLGCFDAADLSKLGKRAAELEQYIVSEIGKHGVKLQKYDTLEAFLSEN